LAVAVTIVSSFLNVKVKPGMAFVGEIGLGGELSGGKALEARTAEAINMGFRAVVTPKMTKWNIKARRRSKSHSLGQAEYGDKIRPCSYLRDALQEGLELDCDLNELLKRKRRSGNRRSSSSSSTSPYYNIRDERERFTKIPKRSIQDIHDRERNDYNDEYDDYSEDE
jgi:hypothetical protein